MANVFTTLEEIRRRPEMHVGGDATDRIAQLQSLETLLYGYSLAVDLHDLDDPGRNFNKSFAAYLHDRFGWATALGPIVAIVDGSPQQDPWERFWDLVGEFREHLAKEAEQAGADS